MKLEMLMHLSFASLHNTLPSAPSKNILSPHIFFHCPCYLFLKNADTNIDLIVYCKIIFVGINIYTNVSLQSITINNPNLPHFVYNIADHTTYFD